MKYILLLITSFILQNGFTQDATSSNNVIVFNTYQDFKKEKGENYGDLVRFIESGGGTGTALYFKVDNKKVKVKTSDIWGFYYKGNLFRIASAYSVPVVVKKIGELVFYTNGNAELDMLYNNKDSGGFSQGQFGYISEGLDNDDLFPINELDRRLKKIFERRPLLKELYECFPDDYPKHFRPNATQIKILFTCMDSVSE